MPASQRPSLSLALSVASSREPVEPVLEMMRDLSKPGMKAAAQAEKTLRSLNHGGGAASPLLPQGVYAEALLSAKYNAIGMYDECGTEVGFCLSPALAMVNHSCLPNCCQTTTGGRARLVALRDIEAGEELSYSYASIEGTTATRRASIESTWGFRCLCARCEGTADCGAFDEEHVCYCGAVCVSVERGKGSCVCNPGWKG